MTDGPWGPAKIREDRVWTILTRLAKQAIKSVMNLKQNPDPFTKEDHFVRQGRTHAAIVMANVHGRVQNDQGRDYFYKEGSV